MDRGDSAIDGGGLLLDSFENNQLKTQNIQAHKKFTRTYVGSEELINGKSRFCLWISDDKRPQAEKVFFIKKRLDQVQSMRLGSSKKQTQEQAKIPHKFGEVRHRESDYTIVVPRVSSENREYLPVGLVRGGTIVWHDENTDGMIDGNDAVWSDFYVWQFRAVNDNNNVNEDMVHLSVRCVAA